MRDWSDRRVLIVGLGASGHAAAKALRGLGAAVSVVDSSEEPSHAGRAEELVATGVSVRLGVSMPGDIGTYDLLVASPGVPDGAEVLQGARRAGVKVISEIELGYELIPNTIVAVTGTNGKTTTTRLVASIIDRPGRRALECGNIGKPLVGLFGKTEPRDILVVEVSSFQLQNIDSFHAHVAVALNIAPDHLDWHGDFEEYRNAKIRIVENQEPGDFFLFNIDDDFCRDLAGRTSAVVIGFGTINEPARGLWVEDGWIMAGGPLGSERRIIPVEEVILKGAHNISNVMAAAGVALVTGEEPGSIRKAVGGFDALEHRMEFVRSVRGISFYNDSKATNPHAALSAVRSFEGPLVVIMGGRNKGLLFDGLASELCMQFDAGKLKGVVLLGECADQMRRSIHDACKPGSMDKVLMAEEMDDSVQKAIELSGGSGAVLFSPASASFDMFDDYSHRGRVFKDAVNRLGER